MSKIVAFDVETPNGNNDRISSIGIAVIEDGIITEAYNQLINPECEFWSRNINLTGITPKGTADAPTFNIYWDSIKELFENNILVAHGATSTDLCILYKTLAAYEIVPPTLKFLCTLDLSRKMYPELPKHGLSELCDQFNIPLKHHDSGSDSRACAELLLVFINNGLKIDDHIKLYDGPGSKNYPKSAKNEEYGPVRFSPLDLIKRQINIVLKNDLSLLNELDTLSSMVSILPYIHDTYPFYKICDTISDILQNRSINNSQKLLLISLLNEALTIEKIKRPEQSIALESAPIEFDNSGYYTLKNIQGKTVCLTGDFNRGSKPEIKEILTLNGARVVGAVSNKLDILLVGDLGNANYLHGNYGAKIEDAMIRINEGVEISIIKEQRFFDDLEDNQ